MWCMSEKFRNFALETTQAFLSQKDAVRFQMNRHGINIHSARRKPGFMSCISSARKHLSGIFMHFCVDYVARHMSGRIQQVRITTI